MQHPLLLRTTRASLCAAASFVCLRQSAQLNPLLPRAYALDGVAMPFAGAAIVDAIEGVVLLWALALARGY